MSREQIPKTEIGKIQRGKLKEQFTAGEFDELVQKFDPRAEHTGTIPDWFHGRVWRRCDRLPRRSGADQPHTSLVFATDDDSFDRLHERMPGGVSILVTPGSGFRELDTRRFEINPAESADFREIIRRVSATHGPIVQVVHLWTAAENAPDDLNLGVLSVLEIMQALAHQSEEAPPVRLHVVTRHAQSVRGDAAPRWIHAAIAGLLTAAESEFPWLTCCGIDLDAPLDSQQEADWILQELRAESLEREVAYRGVARFVPRLERLELLKQPAHEFPFRRNGMYLITGGLGGIGVELSSWLRREFQAKLLLVGRTDLDALSESDPRRAAFEELARSGDVAYTAADVGDDSALCRAVEQAEQAWGMRLEGALHLAGDVAYRTLTCETRHEFLAGLHAKLQGAQAIGRLLDSRPGSFLVAFSSVTSLFGAGGAAAYAAVSRGLEAFCRQRQATTAGWTSCLSWSLWQDVGMSRLLSNNAASRSQGFLEITPENGIISLEVILRRRLPHCYVGLDTCHRNVRRRTEPAECRFQELRGYIQTDTSAATESLEVVDRFQVRATCHVSAIAEIPRLESGEIDRHALATLARGTSGSRAGWVAPRNDLEREIAEVWQELLGIRKIGVRDNFFDVGGHSLLAAQLISRVRRRYGIELPLRELFETPTIEAVARAIEAARSHQNGDNETNEARLRELLEQVEGLSSDETRDRLAALTENPHE